MVAQSSGFEGCDINVLSSHRVAGSIFFQNMRPAVRGTQAPQAQHPRRSRLLPLHPRAAKPLETSTLHAAFDHAANRSARDPPKSGVVHPPLTICCEVIAADILLKRVATVALFSTADRIASGPESTAGPHPPRASADLATRLQPRAFFAPVTPGNRASPASDRYSAACQKSITWTSVCRPGTPRSPIAPSNPGPRSGAFGCEALTRAISRSIRPRMIFSSPCHTPGRRPKKLDRLLHARRRLVRTRSCRAPPTG